MRRRRARKDEDGGQECRPVGDVIPAVMRRLGLEDQQWLFALTDEWSGLVGEVVASHCRPGRVERGVLTIFVDSSVWLNELSRYGQGQILKNLRKRFGDEKIRQVLFRLDPDEGRGGEKIHGLH